MKKRYRVTYVGNDSMDHDRIVWANGHVEAVARVKSEGADTVVEVRKTKNPYVVAAVWIAILAALLWRLCR